MDQSISSKAAKRKRQRLKKKEKVKENSEKSTEVEQHVEIEESKQEEAAGQSDKIIDMNKEQEKSREQILAERQAKKAGKKSKETPAAVTQPEPENPASTAQAQAAPMQAAEKSREQILAERQAKKAGKKGKETASTTSEQPKPVEPSSDSAQKPEKSREQILAEREAKKQAKAAEKKSTDKPAKSQEADVVQKIENLSMKPDQAKEGVKKELTKAERRAIQEAQRAAKAKALEDKKSAATAQKPQKSQETVKKSTAQAPVKPQHQSTHHTKSSVQSTTHKVKLFKHLYLEKPDLNMKVNSDLHPSIVQLGFQYATNSVVGSNARCYAFLQTMIHLIRDYVTPAEKEFSRGLEAELQPAMEYLQKCRPFAVSMTNALKYLKLIISQENSLDNDADKKQRLIAKIDAYAEDQIEKAAEAISMKLCEKISNGDVILTFGCSSLIRRSLIDAWIKAELKFRVIVVDSRPDFEGQQMLESLTMQGINCTYVLINSLSFVMPEVTKVILGAHALLANGTVMSRVGTAQVCLVANAFNVPVMVCCETHKFSERVQTDSFVYNEIGDPNSLIVSKNTGKSSEYLKDWESNNHLTPLNLKYDVTPAELITAVVTEVAILPSTSVQVILRVKPSE